MFFNAALKRDYLQADLMISVYPIHFETPERDMGFELKVYVFTHLFGFHL